MATNNDYDYSSVNKNPNEKLTGQTKAKLAHIFLTPNLK